MGFLHSGTNGTMCHEVIIWVRPCRQRAMASVAMRVNMAMASSGFSSHSRSSASYVMTAAEAPREAEAMTSAVRRRRLGPGGLRSPRHHPCFRPSFIESNCSL